MPPRTRTTTTVVLQFIFDNSLLLMAGAGAALIWANVDLEHYTRFTRAMRFLVNDVGMVFFFALATKEVFEATLPGGPLSSGRQAAVPILAAVGGMVVPATLYAVSVSMLDRPELMRGWAIPCATDIAFSYLIARLIFRHGHPAIPFLLLLAIADDALGLLVLALFYPSGPVALLPLAALLGSAQLVAWLLRRLGVESFWAYIAGPGVLSWIGLYVGGIHPALAMVPIVPLMPHHESDLKVFGQVRTMRLTTLLHFEQWWKAPVQVVLLAFGLVNAGVPLTSVGAVTWIVTGSLIIGKPLGIVLTTLIADVVGFKRARDLDYRALVTMGIAAGMGFTVALFFTTASFPPGQVLDEAKMGALLSFFGGILAFGVGRLLGIRRYSVSNPPAGRGF
jgi:NhaA family Na+:H+ antiporter